MPKFSLLVARFPYLNSEAPDIGDWIARTVPQMKADPTVGDIHHVRIDDTPITMGRNNAERIAAELKCDYLLMVDSDMKPDLQIPGARPFWPTSWAFATQHRHRPCIVAAPYCGPPPFENVYVFRWGNRSNNPNGPDMKLDQYSREEAQIRAGFEEVGALPTGLILIDMRVFRQMQPPFFYYEWTDRYEYRKASTEDVTFTRDAALAGAKLYVNWDAWAGHHKRYTVGKPVAYSVDNIRDQMRLAIANGVRSDEQLIQVGVGEPDDVPGERTTRRRLNELIAQANGRAAPAKPSPRKSRRRPAKKAGAK